MYGLTTTLPSRLLKKAVTCSMNESMTTLPLHLPKMAEICEKAIPLMMLQ
jgi:hypothetical protein